jgi:hypothetical protein
MISAYVEQIKPIPAALLSRSAQNSIWMNSPSCYFAHGSVRFTGEYLADDHVQHHQPRRGFHRFPEGQ